MFNNKNGIWKKCWKILWCEPSKVLLGFLSELAYDVIFKNSIKGYVELARDQIQQYIITSSFTSDSGFYNTSAFVVIYIKTCIDMIMHKPYFKCRAFNSHSALVYTPIWLALPCFSLLAISWNTKEVEKADRNGQYFFLCVKYLFLFKAIGVAKFCRWLLLLVVIFSKEECIKCLNLQNSNHNQILYFFIFKGCCRNCSLFE